MLERDARVGVCTSEYVLLDHASGVRHHDGTTRAHVIDDPLRDFLLRWESDLSMPIHAALFRRSILERMAPPFDRRLRGKEDWLFWVRVAMSGAVFQHLDRVLAVYRVHAGSMTRRAGEMAALAVTATALIAHEIDDDGLLGEFAALQGERIARHYLVGATAVGGSSSGKPMVPLRYHDVVARLPRRERPGRQVASSREPHRHRTPRRRHAAASRRRRPPTPPARDTEACRGESPTRRQRPSAPIR